MYENLSQKIKSYVKLFTIIAMVLVLIGGIAGAILLIRQGSSVSILLGIGAILVAAIVDVVLYYLSCFAYGFGEMLEQQATQISLERQLLNAVRDLQPVNSERKPAACPPPQPAPPPVTATTTYPPHTPYHSVPPRPAYPYPPRPQSPSWPQQPYGQQPQNYCTHTPYGTSTGFNENYHYEPKR